MPPAKLLSIGGTIHKLRQVQIIFFASLAMAFFTSPFRQQGQLAGIAQRKFEHRGKIDSRYDASTNKTTVVLNPYNVPIVDTAEVAANRQYFSIMCGYVYQGQKMTNYPETIEFHIISDGTRGFKFNESQNRLLYIDIDHEQIRLGTMTLVRSKHYALGSSPVNAARSSYLEEMSIILTYQGLLKIAQGKKVSLLLGPERIRLNKEHLEALRDLASRIKL